MKFIFLINLVIFRLFADGKSEEGFFSGRISKINNEINIIRVKVNFDNVKYINPKDIVEFWDEKNPTLKCRGYILGRTADYLMVKIPEIKSCTRNVYFTAGAYFRFYSEDFKNNILMGREVVSILLKKRLAISSQMDDKNKDIVSHQERVNAINSRYQSLREKLDLEWKKELHALEEDKVYATRSFKDLEQRLDEIDQKLELYKVKDENLTLDRWSLDSRLYFKK